MQERCITTDEIATATGLSRLAIQRRAKKEQWETKNSPKRGTKTEYRLATLPEDVRKALSEESKGADTTEQEQPKEQPEEQPTVASEQARAEEQPEKQPTITPKRSLEKLLVNLYFTNFKEHISSMAARLLHKRKEQPPAPPPEWEERIEPMLRQREVEKLTQTLENKSVIILGKAGIGKTYVFNQLARHIAQDYNKKVIVFKEPPTQKTITMNVALTAGLANSAASKEIILKSLEEYSGDRIVVCIDSLEKILPGAVEVIDTLMGFPWFRFVGAGHLGNKRKYNSTWMKASAEMLQPLTRTGSMELIDWIWPDGDVSHKRTIIDTARNIPGHILRMAKEGKQGILPQEEQRYLDFTPIILVIATLGFAIKVIGTGYSSTDSIIVGGIIAAICWGLFWIYRGYAAGWWGSKRFKQFSQKRT